MEESSDQLCELCGEKSNVDFKALIEVPGGRKSVFMAQICLVCWGNFSGDVEVISTVMAKRSERLEELFGIKDAAEIAEIEDEEEREILAIQITVWTIQGQVLSKEELKAMIELLEKE